MSVSTDGRARRVGARRWACSSVLANQVDDVSRRACVRKGSSNDARPRLRLNGPVAREARPVLPAAIQLLAALLDERSFSAMRR